MEKEIISVVKYFSFFAYQPTLDEINTFVQVKISRDELKKELKRLKYTPPQYSIRRKISKRKFQNWRFRTYIKLLSLFPQIKLVGLSGSIAMMNASENDDIDLFIITEKNRLFTARLIALALAQLLDLRRARDSATQIFQKTNKTEKFAFASSHRHKNKVCLNLFFDENNLKVPKFKQTEFVGHEVLQMKPIINKNYTYEKFLKANLWVYDIFPNSSWIMSKVKSQKSKIQVKSQNYFKNFKLLTLTSNFLLLTFNFIESILKNLQLTLINRHRTTELISNFQLWFHPDDFEKKIKKLGRTTASACLP
ncbi:MAG: hypothetical protein Q7U68_00210, partial [Candidatus Roizmanbacteria bacterium]|nr:hypothetical protein [Candidatus Roizmanbacteria bacterium]